MKKKKNTSSSSEIKAQMKTEPDVKADSITVEVTDGKIVSVKAVKINGKIAKAQSKTEIAKTGGETVCVEVTLSIMVISFAIILVLRKKQNKVKN